jgi:ABC-type nitrate/sulfonate/bicarbonate transport system permease component
VTVQSETGARPKKVSASDEIQREDVGGLVVEAPDGRPKLSWSIIIGLALTALGVVWWAISYSQITADSNLSLVDATQCLFFRNEYCEGLIEASDSSFPLYYHLYTLWLGLLFLAIGLWRLTRFSTDPPEWFLPYRITFFRICALLLLILLWWEAAARAGPNLLADPVSTFQAAIEMFGQDRNNLRVGFFDSLRVYASGFFFATLVGIPIGLILGGFRVLGRTMEVFANALMATPRVAFIPLIIVFLGLGYEAKSFIVFLGAVMPILVNTYAGVRNSDGELVEMARSAGARRGQIFVRILLPGALPFIVVGLRIGATIGLINTVVAEIYLASSGLGGLINAYRAAFRPANYLVVVLCLSIIGVVVTSLLRMLESRTERWRYNG